MQFAQPSRADGAAAAPREAPQPAGEPLAPAAQTPEYRCVPPAYAPQHALVAAPPPGAAWGAVPPAYAPQHALVASPYGFPPVAAPPPPYPAVAPDNALTALERALAPKVEPTPAFLELERWVEAHVANVGRRQSVLDAAESLEDLKACDAEELEEILDLNTWPRLARQRFLGAWAQLKDEEEAEEEEGALVPFTLPRFTVDPDREALVARVARAGRDAMDVDGGGDVAAPVQEDDDVEAPAPGADMTGETSNHESEPDDDEAPAPAAADEVPLPAVAPRSATGALIARAAPIERTTAPRPSGDERCTSVTNAREYVASRMSSGRTLAQATAELKYDIKRGYFRVLTEDDDAEAAPAPAVEARPTPPKISRPPPPKPSRPSRTAEERFRVGERVEVRYRQGPRWYRARVATVNVYDARAYHVVFDDGDSESNVRSPFIRRVYSKAPRRVTPTHRKRPAPRMTCPICLDTLRNDACAQHLTCGHAFHTKCLRELADHVRLSSHTRRSLAVSCPLCRTVTRAEVGGADI